MLRFDNSVGAFRPDVERRRDWSPVGCTTVSGEEIHSHHDVVIVGAGPAGATAAAALLGRRSELSVLLVDKAEFPRDKCCGDGIGPGVVDVAERLGLTGLFDDEAAVGGCTIIGPRGARVDGELPLIDGRRICGYVIPRTQFDARVLRAATDRGAELAGERFVGTWMAGTRRIVELGTGESRRLVSTSLLIGADGANSRVRRALGVKRNGDRLTGIAVRAYVDVLREPLESRQLLFEFSEELLPAYAWYFPATGGFANVGLGVPVSDHKRRKLDLDEMLGRFLDTMRARGYELGEPRSSRTYLLPLASRLPRLVHERAVLIGDAGSMINPLSGEGIFYAMAAAEMLTPAAQVLADDHDPAPVLRDWERRFRKRFVAHYRSNALAQQMLRSAGWSKLAIRAAANDERVFAAAVQLLFGEGRIKVSTTLRLAAAGLR
jgi:menaquinone-9 beta-reductase